MNLPFFKRKPEPKPSITVVTFKKAETDYRKAVHDKCAQLAQELGRGEWRNG